MPRSEKAFCLYCNQYHTRALERRHRREALATSFLSPAQRHSSRHAITWSDVESSDDNVSGAESLAAGTQTVQASASTEVAHDANINGATDMPAADMDFDDVIDDFLEAGWDLSRNFWTRRPLEAESESEDEENFDKSSASDPDDSDDEEVLDWSTIGVRGLSAWDRLGEAYERRVAELVDRLTEYDLSLCRVFAFKLSTHATDAAYEKIPFAFLQDPPLPTLKGLRSRIMFLSGFQPQTYHCCVNSCVCFVGPYKDDEACSYCAEPRYQANRQPRRIFTYLPLIPRLIAFFANRQMASLLLYRSTFKHQPGTTQDVFDGEHYRTLRQQYVTVEGQKLSHKFFDGSRDIALGLSTDGFAPFKRRRNTAWPLIIFLYNLPPDLRFLLGYILSLGVIPGPSKPKNMDSFLWPFIQEMLQLARGVTAFDILESELFLLRAYLILVFGDMPAISMVMRMKGHNGISPCRMCEIKGLRIPNSRSNAHYVPLDQSRHPAIQDNPERIQVYNPDTLPLRTHDRFLQQAAEVDAAITNAAVDSLSKQYGIKGTPLLAALSSLSFPHSFPHDFMHLIWENNVDNLISHWNGSFKNMDDGSEAYQFSKTVWEEIGTATAAAGRTIPSAYGSRVPNIATHRSSCSAEMISFWTMYIAPVLLQPRFSNPKYFNHFVKLVRIVTLCLQFEITDEQIEEVRQDIVAWVKDYEAIYYQHNLERLSACPLTVHALLHIADSIKFAGPVWCYWAYPMERYCGHLQPAIKSRRFPYASLDRYVTEVAQLSQIKITRNVSDQLALKSPRSDVKGSLRLAEYAECLLLPPKSVERPNEHIQTITAAVATRFNIPISSARVCVRDSLIQEWGKVRRIDSSEGDTFRASGLGVKRDDSRDASFVRYEMLVDKFARRARQRPQYELKTFYGQLQHIYLIRFPRSLSARLKINPPNDTTVLLAGIRSCKLDNVPSSMASLDIHLYSTFGSYDVVDIMTVQALVGRVRASADSRQWAIIDRSGSLARALWIEDDAEEVDENTAGN